MTSSNDAAARAAIAALHDAWADAVTRGDADALLPLLTDDYEVWANGAPPLSGSVATAKAMRGAFARVRVVQRFDAIELVVRDDWAFERGIETVTVTPHAGGGLQPMSQRATLVLRRDDDGAWRFARGMTNALPPSDEAAH